MTTTPTCDLRQPFQRLSMVSFGSNGDRAFAFGHGSQGFLLEISQTLDRPTLGSCGMRSDSEQMGCGQPHVRAFVHTFASQALLPSDIPLNAKLGEDILEEVDENSDYFSKHGLIWRFHGI
ncbi:hypothetical protein SUGI_0177410 [Cryptomeria japonica]|nr:hypothetical protein SUGI_0177410 [Cryptomeria japonica]